MESLNKLLEIDFVLVNVRGFFKDLVLYSIMKLGKAHGYAIKKFLSQVLEIYVPSSGILYPTLHELEKEGLLKSFIERNRKVYALTDKGNEYVKNRIESIEKTLKKINKAIEIASYIGLKDMFKTIKILWDLDIEPPQDVLNEIKVRISEIINILNNVIERNNRTVKTNLS